MLARFAKVFALAMLLLTGTGVLPDYCFGPCAPKEVLVTLDDVDPPNGSEIAEAAVTVTFSGTDERSVEATDYSMTGQLLRRVNGGAWETVTWLWEPDMVIGPWEPGGVCECGNVRELTAIPVEDVPLGEGVNELQLRVVVTDGYKDIRTFDVFVTYTH